MKTFKIIFFLSLTTFFLPGFATDGGSISIKNKDCAHASDKEKVLVHVYPESSRFCFPVKGFTGGEASSNGADWVWIKQKDTVTAHLDPRSDPRCEYRVQAEGIVGGQWFKKGKKVWLWNYQYPILFAPVNTCQSDAL